LTNTSGVYLSVSMKQKRSKLNQVGFTLVELMVAIAVGAIMISCAHVAYTAQLGLTQQTRDLILSNSFAEGKAEELRSKGYLGISDGTTDISAQMPSTLQRPRSADITVTSQSASVKKVVLNVRYSNQGSTQTHVYTTYIGELGVGQY
jgi:prepilin-type N-terminal cleavage/methylation domain-containing protein